MSIYLSKSIYIDVDKGTIYLGKIDFISLKEMKLIKRKVLLNIECSLINRV